MRKETTGAREKKGNKNAEGKVGERGGTYTICLNSPLLCTTNFSAQYTFTPDCTRAGFNEKGVSFPATNAALPHQI